MAPTEFVGSHEKANNSYGRNGYPGASSLTPGQTTPNIADVSVPTPTVANANAAGDDARMAAIIGEPIKAHDSMPPRAVDNGSPGGKVPSANVRRSRTDGVGRPTR